MIKTAVILAAGVGSRLLKHTKDKPKGFLLVENMPIIERSVQKLIEAGIERIVIGTGHCKEMYERLAVQYPMIECIVNPSYAKTGSMYTLFTLKNYLSEDFLLLESDLLYDKAALKVLLHHPRPDVILASEHSNSGDEVFIETDSNDNLIKMSKQRNLLDSTFAELVGISKISFNTYTMMCNYTERLLPTNPSMDYEEALVGISQLVDIYVQKLVDFAWCEIDNEYHLQRAVNDVYPQIKNQERIYHGLKRNILLNPGPATTTESVKNAQVVPDICPREKEFGSVMQFISTELTRLVANPLEYTTVLFAGSGTAAVESILSSVIGDKTLLIINNGAYGKRMCQIADAYGLNYIEFASPSDQPINLTTLELTILQSPHKISFIAMVHNETTTGLLNDVLSVGCLSKNHEIQLIVDAMSSYAGIPIDMETMNICYLAASSNKNLQGMAGVSFVIAKIDSLEKTLNIKPHNLYLNLYSQYKYFQKTSQMRFTPPVQTLYALKQAILETQLEGIENRYLRYSKSWDTLIQGLTSFGLTHLVATEHHSRLITAIIEPDCPNYDFNTMHDYCYNQGFTIYPGKLDGQNTFRIANIGDITHKDIAAFLVCLEKYLRQINFII